MINNDELLETILEHMQEIKRWGGRREGDINKLIDLQSPLLLFSPFSHILKVKLKLKLKDLINYQNMFHKSKTIFRGH
jgi:hypothetical protein